MYKINNIYILSHCLITFKPCALKTANAITGTFL